MIIKSIKGDQRRQKEALLVWEASVRATHDFLEESDIETLKPIVSAGLSQIPSLYGCFEEDVLLGFAGVASEKLEMLFIEPSVRNTGMGRLLAEYAIGADGVRFVDVNEQNAQAVGFYEHLGFEAIGRSPLDEQGNPFPIIHMEHRQDAKKRS